MRTLVTGATGFLGGHLVRLLREQGREVAALCRGEAPELAKLGVTVVPGDVLAGESIERAAAGCDALFHCAGLVSRKRADTDRMWKVHVEGTRTTLDAARRAGVKRAVVASTSGTVAVSDHDETRAEDAPTPFGLIARWPYYRSKLYQEQAALERNGPEFQVVSVNPSLLLGPGDLRGSSTGDVRLFLERKVQAVPAGGMSFVDVRDAAAALCAAMDKGAAGERYLVSGCNCSVREFFGKLERLSGVKAPWLPMPKNAELAKLSVRLVEKLVDRFGGKPPVDEETVDIAQHYWYCDWSKAERELGFAPRDPMETLRDTIDDLRERGVVWPEPKAGAA